MDAKTAQSVFGAVRQSKKSTSKEETTENFKSSNESLVKKYILLKNQLTQCTKTVEKLRNENVALREKNQELIDASLDRKIELIVEQRVKSRLAHAAVLHKRLFQTIQQTGLELNGIFKDMEPEPSDLITRRAPRMEVNLERVEESPVRQSSVDNYDDENVYGEDDITISSATTSFVQNLENGTPRTKQSGPKGRRSQLFPSLQEEVLSGEEVSVVSTVVRRAPMLIAPSATPGGPSKPASRKAATPRFKKPSTPVVAPSCDPDEGGPSTVRRQRSAKMNIKSMKEPSTGSKLRRPGKHDEPMPYISSFY
ncbi:hypothetical protein GCK72_014838 [Caenorhabditis remanei]|uniref:Uncharacterized protein n=1 Tax=Caenorhabditis remanei TaxID=31234 RepID=A0A6A5GSH8_CAERE|nr:hypothetical protein GCK72_014838 [Caenorhabditis remanei]KAF1758380.1 hypothetical protein GCK72_014838 [Caenorhabditis remanei]